MRSNTVLAATLALASLTTATAAQEAAPQPEISFESTELAPGLYALMGVGGFAGGNVGLSIGEDSVFLIDDGMPPLTDELLEAIGELTDRPVDFLVNTHVHGDHVGGNAVLAEAGATIVAHDNLRKRLATDGMPTPNGMAPAPEKALPVITFSDSTTFHLNGRTAFVFHVERAHTDGDAVIHFREDNVVHTGDLLFNRLFPFIDLDSGGSVDGYLAAQKRVLELADAETKIISGHGDLATREDLAAAVAMLEDARGRVRALLDEGKTGEEIHAANPLADYHDEWNWGFITTERMTETLIRGLSDN